MGKKGLRRVFALLFALVGLQALFVLVHLSQYPIFPEFNSLDFIKHVQIAQSLAAGQPFSLASAVLYYGVEFYLAAFLLLFHGDPLTTVRYAMGLLVIISPLLVFAAAKEVFQRDASAAFSTLLYTVSGFVWFGMVFNSSLFANFFGLLASLALVTAYLRGIRTKKVGVWGFVLLIATIGLAYFSHYTTLFVIALLPLAGLWIAKSKPRGLLFLGLTWAPALIGVALFPSLLDSLSSFASPKGSALLLTSFSALTFPTALGSVFAFVPSVANLIDLMTNDYLAFVLLAAFGYFAYLTVREKKPEMVLMAALFLLPLALAPNGDDNWRFVFPTLLFLTLMSGDVMGRLWPSGWTLNPRGEAYRRYRALKGHPNGVVLALGLLMIAPTFIPSVAFNSLVTSLPQQASSQASDWNALQWMKSHQTGCGTYFDAGKNLTFPASCSYVSVADWRFSYSPFLQGPVVYVADLSGVTWFDPGQVSYFAESKNASYIIVTKVVTDPANPVTVLRTLNATTSAMLTTDIEGVMRQIPTGLGGLSTSPQWQSGGLWFQEILLDRSPWLTFTPLTLGNAQVAYNDSSNVVIYCILQNGCSQR